MGARRCAMSGTQRQRLLGVRGAGVNRRGFLRTGGRTLAGLAGILAAGRAPGSGAAREIAILTAVNYAPASDAKLAGLGKRVSKLTGANVRIDHIQSGQIPGKLSAELKSETGHDIVRLEKDYPWRFP